MFQCLKKLLLSHKIQKHSATILVLLQSKRVVEKKAIWQIETRIQRLLCTFYPRGGTCENFDRDACVIFLGLKFTKMSFFGFR